MPRSLTIATQANGNILRRVRGFAPYPHQARLCREVHQILKVSSVALIQAPPASGKTTTIFLHGQYEGAPGMRVILSGRDDLVEQTRTSIAKLQGLLEHRAPAAFAVQTWQSMISLLGEPFGSWTAAHAVNAANAAVRAVRDFRPAKLTTRQVQALRDDGRISQSAFDVYMLLRDTAFIYLDEVHSGASGDADVFRGITALFPHAKIIGVSATPWGLSGLMFPNIEAITATYTYDDARSDNVVADVELIQVDTGLDVTMQDQNRPKSRRIVASADKAVDVAREVAEKGVTGTDAKETLLVRTARVRAMFNVYLERHTSPKATPERAIFFVDSRQMAGIARREIMVMAQAANRDVFASCYHGLSDDDSADEMGLCGDRTMGPRARLRQTLADFYEGGQPDILICVDMLVEGYDDPPLGNVFDCAFNQDNVRRTVQKIGRIMRPHPSKVTGKYYYAMDFSYYLSRPTSDADPMITEPPNSADLRKLSLRETRMRLSTDGLHTDRLKQVVDVPPRDETVLPMFPLIVDADNGSVRPLRLTSMPLFAPPILKIREVSDRWEEVKAVTFYDVFDERKSNADAAREGIAFIRGVDVESVRLNELL